MIIGARMINTYKCTGVPRSFLHKPNSNVVMYAEFNYPQSVSRIINVIKTIVKFHPLLRVSLKINENGEARFEADKKTAVKFFIGKDKENVIIERSLHSPINPLKDGLYRFILAGDRNECRGIIIVCHHIICDGISLLNILRDISRIMSGEKLSYNYTPDILCEKMLPQPVISNMVRKFVKKKNRIWKNKTIERSEYVLDKIISIYLDEQKFHTVDFFVREKDFAALFRAAKYYQVSINSIITGLILCSELQAFHKTDYRFKFSTAVNLRPFLKNDVEDQYGHFASGFQHKERIKIDKFWKQVKKLDKKLLQKLHSDKIFMLLAMELFHPNYIDAIDYNRYNLRNDADIRKWNKMTGLDRISSSFIISNLGNADWANTGTFYKKITGPYMISDVTEKYIGAVTVNNNLTLSFSYIEKNLKNITINRFIDALRNNLDTVLNSFDAE
jgi:NRPS condensation-like uncharacterized protein